MGRSRLYVAYGLTIRSDIPLPELPLAGGAQGASDVVVRRGDLPPPPAFPDGATRYRYVEPRTAEAYFAWQELGAFRVRGGCEILIDARAGIPDEQVRLPLLGILLGTLLHQRGLFTLHASAVAIGSGAVAFIGPKGAGKSTTAAALLRRGHGLVTDDVLALDVGPEKGVLAYPAFPQVKLWPASADELGYDAHSLPRLSSEVDKRFLRSVKFVRQATVPLTHIFLLHDGSNLVAERIRGNSAFATLMAESYAPRFLGSTASTSALFETCRRVANRVPIYRLQRPKDFSALPKAAHYLERLCCGVQSSMSDHPVV
jgi:hypothetical protein